MQSNSNSGWTGSESPFHPGELAIQARLGVQDRMDKQGRRIIRDYLPLQHQQFYAQLSYVLVGTVDSAGHPWASMLTGQPGFLNAPDDRTLQVAAKPLLGDPLAHNLTVGCDIGFLGIELQTRRRNRINGRITALDPDGFAVQVGQTFGNCPQYIQARTFEWEEFVPNAPKPVYSLKQWGEPEKALIRGADTFFIATAYQASGAESVKGVDVSHRGGKPGFVRIDDDNSLTIPDFSGNYHFNTLGNLELNPQAGLLFIDFNQGDLLYVTGTAEVIWEGPESSTYAGAERLLRFRLNQGYRVEGSLPFRWSTPDVSPFLKDMGAWV